ncbi:BA5345 family protein [Lentibacillus cibarius]|uniref:Uncharacterized protein n=1 Tax=Lentibacillus cibarius TaxID=2583219 RepID=A0A5S3R6S1_9BACI|nr:hypothetical protein [Lentibacillus cibarius]TMN20933.1 hypothetical protein FFL34_01520 [Lentibacillus cibarius]
MRFDSKYLIRWGIPGWTIIFGFGLYFCLTYDFEQNLLNGSIQNSTDLLAIMFSLIVVSVPVGYLLHQAYFIFDFYDKRKKRKVIDEILNHYKDFEVPYNWDDLTLNEKYFFIEYEWHTSLLKMEDEQRNYIAGRYRYLLTTKHSLGVLRFSLGTVIFIIFAYQLLYLQFQHIWGCIIYLVLLLLFFVFSWFNFKYYSKNLNTIQGKFMQYIKKREQEKILKEIK